MESEEVILRIGAEGGSIALLGIETAGGWHFHMATDESTFYDLLDEEDRPAEYRQEDWIHESRWVDSWDAALELLDEHPWHNFYPLQVHPDFKQAVLEAVKERFARGEREGGRWRLEDWRQICGEESGKDNQ